MSLLLDTARRDLSTNSVHWPVVPLYGEARRAFETTIMAGHVCDGLQTYIEEDDLPQLAALATVSVDVPARNLTQTEFDAM